MTSTDRIAFKLWGIVAVNLMWAVLFSLVEAHKTQLEITLLRQKAVEREITRLQGEFASTNGRLVDVLQDVEERVDRMEQKR